MCFAPSVLRHARQCRRSVGACLLAALCPDRHDKDVNRKRLTGKNADTPHSLAFPPSRHRSRPPARRTLANSRLEHRASLDGRSVHAECASLWPNTLPLHGAILPRDDLARPGVRSGCCPCQLLRVACPRGDRDFRRQGHLVGDRKGMGQVFVVPSEPRAS